MKSFFDALKNQANKTRTQNGAVAYRSSLSNCLDLFFAAGAMRNTEPDEIAGAVLKAYAENPEKALKIIFFARDVRGGLGERRFFRIAVKTLAENEPDAVMRNIPLFAVYGRFDDLLVLFGTPCEKAAAKEIRKQFEADINAMQNGESVTLLAKWLPSVNASSEQTKYLGKRVAGYLGLSEREYRKMLSSLRAYSEIIENRLRVKDYTFDYSKQCSGAMFKYRRAFIRNDGERYAAFIRSAEKGETTLNASTLYPYEIVRRALQSGISDEERKVLDVTWKSLTDYGNGAENQNALCVIDGSGSMTWGRGSVRPIDAALSLGIYFAERNKGVFANSFITFSQSPQLVEVRGADITEKVRYCSRYNEVANTNLEAVFELILAAAVQNGAEQSDIPSRLYIISDMEFDGCVIGGNDTTLFSAMKKRYAKYGYNLPEIVFWNVNSFGSNVPVKYSMTGAALVSGASPAVFDMVKDGEINPEKIMNDVIGNERYKAVG